MTTVKSPRTIGQAVRAFLRYGSPRLLSLQLGVALVARCFLERPGLDDLVIAAGVAVYWPVQEWVLHRFILHAPPLRFGSFVYETAAARKHRQHHDTPLEPSATLLPTWTIATLIPVHLLLWKIIAPTPATACTGVALLGGAALAYEWIHFLTHTGHRPRSRWFREVKRRHLAHHFRTPERWFAFVVPAIDDWFGTGDGKARVTTGKKPNASRSR